jgi:diaminopimelate epimerase
MKGSPFWKMSGSGNDFILMDHREVAWKGWDLSVLTRKICRRRLSVGADGLILLVPPRDPQNDFAWRFFNSDGSEAEMCGNGARCAARFAQLKGLAADRMRFETLSGVIEAEVQGERVRVRMGEAFKRPKEKVVRADGGDHRLIDINTGVPHAVRFVEEVEAEDVVNLGRAIRYHEAFAPAGTNVDFVQIVDPQTVKMRTYERGVEDETLACGTGAVASALAANFLGKAHSPVCVVTRSGRTLTIHFESRQDGYGPVYLEGDVQRIYEGQLLPDAYE